MPSATQPLRAVIYARVSQDRDGSRTSVDQQLRDCRKLAEDRGFNVLAELVDNDLSAYTGKPRPEYERLLQMIRDGDTDVVIVWEQSRLTRRPYELEGYMEVCIPRKVPTHFVTAGTLDLTSDQGQMVARMTGAVNRYEVDQLRGRVKRGLRARAESGKPLGGRRPWGFQSDRITHEPEEADAIRDATERIVAGESVHGIARAWRARGLVTTTGKTWSTGQLRALLRRPRNAGLIQHGGAVRPGKAAWEPIVPVAVWAACVAVLDDPTRRLSTGNQPAYLGTFLFTCGAVLPNGDVCGKLMRSWRSGTPPVRAYRCTTEDRTSNHVTIPIEPADRHVAEQITGSIWEHGIVLPEPGEIPVVVRPATEGLEDRRRKLAMQFASGYLTEEDYDAATAILAAQLAEPIVAAPLRKTTDHAYDLAHARSTWSELSLNQQRAIIEEIAHVTILPVGGGSRAPIEQRVGIEIDFSRWE